MISEVTNNIEEKYCVCIQCGWGGRVGEGGSAVRQKSVFMAVVITHNSISYHDNICQSIRLCLTSVNQSLWHVKTVLINKDTCLDKCKTNIAN